MSNEKKSYSRFPTPDDLKSTTAVQTITSEETAKPTPEETAAALRKRKRIIALLIVSLLLVAAGIIAILVLDNRQNNKADEAASPQASATPVVKYDENGFSVSSVDMILVNRMFLSLMEDKLNEIYENIDRYVELGTVFICKEGQAVSLDDTAENVLVMAVHYSHNSQEIPIVSLTKRIEGASLARQSEPTEIGLMSNSIIFVRPEQLVGKDKLAPGEYTISLWINDKLACDIKLPVQ